MNLLKQYPWQLICVCLALFIVIWISFDGCGKDPDFKFSDKLVKGWQKEIAANKKENEKLKIENAVLKGNEALINQTVVNAEQNTLKWKQRYIKEKNKPIPVGCDTVINQIVEVCDSLSNSYETQISAKDSLIENKSEQIVNLESQNANHELNAVMYGHIKTSDDDKIRQQAKQIRNLKIKQGVFLGTTGAAIIAAVTLGILNATK